MDLWLDIGCGPNKEQGCIGIDHYNFKNVDIVRCLTRGLPFCDDLASGVKAKHILEHFDGENLIFIIEEIYRVCKDGSKVYVEVPAYDSPNCGKDFTHKKKDWDEHSFDMWKKSEDSTFEDNYIIDRGPMYGIKGCFNVSYNYDPNTKNAHYTLEVIK
tara:strand:- start:363 stop:836 length:474 start_codon:yes stop_codon:yes gene_type:complete